MASQGEVFSASWTEITDFCKRHRILLVSAAVAGIGVLALRRYFAGGVCTSTTRLDGKTVIITGANTGIGKITALDMAKRGARVVLACRDITKAERAAAEMIRESNNTNVVVKVVDLASLESVRKFCRDINTNEKRVDVLVNNAGIMACPKWETEDGFEMQIGVNHLGHFLLTNLLLDKLKASTPSRIVNVSSLAHERGKVDLDDLHWRKRPYDTWKAYSQSKVANVFFTRELARRLKDSGVSAFSLHPGVVRTELSRYMADAGVPGWQRWLFRIVFAPIVKTPQQGAQTSIHCAVAEGLEEHSGKYFSDCALKKEAEYAQDPAIAAKLWQLSEKEVGLSK